MSQMLHGAMAKAMLDDLHRTSARRQRATEAAVSRRPARPDAVELRPDRLADRWRLRALAAAARVRDPRALPEGAMAAMCLNIHTVCSYETGVRPPYAEKQAFSRCALLALAAR